MQAIISAFRWVLFDGVFSILFKSILKSHKRVCLFKKYFLFFFTICSKSLTLLHSWSCAITVHYINPGQICVQNNWNLTPSPHQSVFWAFAQTELCVHYFSPDEHNSNNVQIYLWEKKRAWKWEHAGYKCKRTSEQTGQLVLFAIFLFSRISPTTVSCNFLWISINPLKGPVMLFASPCWLLHNSLHFSHFAVDLYMCVIQLWDVWL